MDGSHYRGADLLYFSWSNKKSILGFEQSSSDLFYICLGYKFLSQTLIIFQTSTVSFSQEVPVVIVTTTLSPFVIRYTVLTHNIDAISEVKNRGLCTRAIG